MRYRKLSPTGDFTFGQQQTNFYVNQPEAPAQAVQTRLELRLGSWFLDTSDGTDWANSVLGVRTGLLRDPVIRNRVLTTQGITAIDNYNSVFEPNTRAFSATFGLETQYGTFGPSNPAFVTPGVAADRIPTAPTNVIVTVLSDTSVDVTWTASS
jgi:hypothetical protein